jgi:vanillate O-demethylase monooxygenase subunit
MNREPTPELIEQFNVAMRPYWYPVLPSSELPTGELRGVELLEEPLVLARLNGGLVALRDVCRHFQAQLSLGEICEIEGHGACIMCPYHGWSYAADGQCVDIPQLGPDRAIPRDARVAAYAIEERYGLIWVCLDDTPRFPLPSLPGLEDPSFLLGPIRSYQPWVASAPRVIMAALDDTHAPWVHGGLLGDRDYPAPPDHRVWRQDQYLRVEFTMLQPDNRAIAEDSAEVGGVLREVRLNTTVSMPNVIHFVIQPVDRQGELTTIIWQAVCPRRYNCTDTYWGSARNYDRELPTWNDDFENMQDVVRAQDRRVVESQRPWLLPPFWTKIELPLRPADLPLIEYHRWLEELGITLAL